MEGQSYRFIKMMVRMFKGKKFLSTSKIDSEVEEIYDIGEVEVDDDRDEVEEEESGSGRLTKGVRIIAVDRIMQYNGCLKCSARVEEDEEDAEFGECTKCKMFQCLDDCKHNLSTQLTLKVTGKRSG